jgi:hypothetical protein
MQCEVNLYHMFSDLRVQFTGLDQYKGDVVRSIPSYGKGEVYFSAV